MRTFVAIPVLDDLPVRHLVECRKFLQTARADVKWVADGHFHITLRFIGETTEEQLASLKQCVSSLTGSGPIEAALDGIGAFPSAARPQTLWAGVTKPGNRLAGIERALSKSLEDAGFAQERKPFHPHITLGRVRSQRGINDLVTALKSACPLAGGLDFTADRVTLFESNLTPAGPRYTALLNVSLGPES